MIIAYFGKTPPPPWGRTVACGEWQQCLGNGTGVEPQPGMWVTGSGGKWGSTPPWSVTSQLLVARMVWGSQWWQWKQVSLPHSTFLHRIQPTGPWRWLLSVLLWPGYSPVSAVGTEIWGGMGHFHSPTCCLGPLPAPWGIAYGLPCIDLPAGICRGCFLPGCLAAMCVHMCAHALVHGAPACEWPPQVPSQPFKGSLLTTASSQTP